jgi:hypothetical protein
MLKSKKGHGYGIRKSLSWAKSTVANAYDLEVRNLEVILSREPSPVRRKARLSS